MHCTFLRSAIVKTHSDTPQSIAAVAETIRRHLRRSGALLKFLMLSEKDSSVLTYEDDSGRRDKLENRFHIDWI
jgi:hypothetical protein